MILEGMHIYLNIIASKFTIWLLYLSLLFSFLRGTFLIQVRLQMYWEPSPLIAIFFHSFLHFPLCFVLITLYLLFCLKSELRSCSSACSWAVLLCKLAQANFFFFKKKHITDRSLLVSHSNTQTNSGSHQPQAPYQVQIKLAGKQAGKECCNTKQRL